METILQFIRSSHKHYADMVKSGDRGDRGDRGDNQVNWAREICEFTEDAIIGKLTDFNGDAYIILLQQGERILATMTVHPKPVLGAVYFDLLVRHPHSEHATKLALHIMGYACGLYERLDIVMRLPTAVRDLLRSYGLQLRQIDEVAYFASKESVSAVVGDEDDIEKLIMHEFSSGYQEQRSYLITHVPPIMSDYDYRVLRIAPK